MKGMIPKNFIDELLHLTNIIDIINIRAPLKKIGKNYSTHCPFHKENTPSFTVSYEKQFYYCFGCNSHGNVIDFLINYEKLTFVESIEELANFNGLKIPYKKEHYYSEFDYEKRNNLYSITEKFAYIYHKNVFETKNAYEYLTKRGIHACMIKYFNIGFSNINWKNTEKKIKINTINIQELIDAGILIINNKGYKYDRFRGRIIFPIRNKNGKVIGFGGRALNNNFPKYINSPETNIFKKGQNLYGLFETLKHNSKPKKLLIVEGYIDVITLFQFNINYSISSLGTAITSYQVQLLFRFTNTIICCYDGDVAGERAAWRTLKITLPYIYDGKNIQFIFLPLGEDPDTMIRKEGKEKFEQRISNAISLSKFLFDKLFKNIDLSFINEKSYLSSIAIPLINQIPSDTTRMYLLQKLGIKIGVPDQNILRQLHTKAVHNTLKNNNEYKHITKITIRNLIGLLIQNPNLVFTITSIKHLKNFHLNGLPTFLNLVNKCIKYPNHNTGQILEMYRNTIIFKKLNQLAKWNHMIADNQIKQVFLDSLNNLHNRALENKKSNLISKERKIGLKKDEKYELWLINKKLAKI
ncbi:DNA primase [Buchnera aphidicola]|uniref:DNA primase n=1 Tax=Buchnera aphidicola subsp. Melaphis rhois TaxID=118103 RepID=A0A4D6Y0N0_BUCMH|nr:DNA primase [Buchnera aphidicola]QCI23096.1 DNA primase [Buchnera aphidicola (Melaphis rhois)]